jgi:hypothetical protein
MTTASAPSDPHRWVSYTTGSLTLDASGAHLTNLDAAGTSFGARPNGVTNEGTQIFSDRMWSFPSPTPTSFVVTHPFDPDRPDKLGLRIELATGQTEFTALSWGNGRVAGTLRCANGVLYGFLDDGSVLFIRLSQDSFTPPPGPTIPH